MHLARIRRNGNLELKKDPWLSLGKLPHKIVDDFIRKNWRIMIDDEMISELQKMGFKDANSWTVKYRRRRLGLKKYLHGDILKHKAWVRTQAIKKYGHTCELCDYSLAVETHHIVPKYQGGLHEIENLMVLCPNCHALITRGKIAIKSRAEIFRVRKFMNRKLENLSTSHFVRRRRH
jgi:predicted restriction endonuclease